MLLLDFADACFLLHKYEALDMEKMTCNDVCMSSSCTCVLNASVVD